ncbi:MAG: precorrin-2 C(20)-methyltransferase [Methanobrevibacter sp.]|uniref:precorrin-2 C(20)-methyltransferase n=1 Tax=Methanobrevibacter sp. TaxID=66852 RepID=UPI0026E01B9E|nr:precorrin-2 C(20)-methyltransferase [Methanobrevibacter sp.]MDO5848627.1 precorrin-2 C(20)-methyltransferase [Methanobrevibacter sp.]
MSEKGKLYGIGVGPGDVELLTLKAARILKTVPVICSPKSAKEKDSIALSIVEPIIDEREDSNKVMLVEPIFPMIENDEQLEKVWDSAAELIAHYLDSGRDVAFVTLGDPSVFSTFSYVQKRLKEKYEVEVIPGITAFTACAAACEIPIVEKNQVLTIVPKIDDRLEEIMNYSDSIVLMKASRNTKELEELIESKNKEKIICSVENCTRENEKIIDGFSEDKPYLTTTLIKFTE